MNPTCDYESMIESSVELSEVRITGITNPITINEKYRV